MKLTFRGHRIYSSIPLDETNTMGPTLLGPIIAVLIYENEKVILRGEISH